MTPSDNFQVVLCTINNTETAQTLATSLLEAKLCACVNIVPKIESHYWWEGKLCHDTESQLIIKTTKTKYEALEQHIREHHPYDCPEILALDVVGGNNEYLNWIFENVS